MLVRFVGVYVSACVRVGVVCVDARTHMCACAYVSMRMHRRKRVLVISAAQMLVCMRVHHSQAYVSVHEHMSTCVCAYVPICVSAHSAWGKRRFAYARTIGVSRSERMAILTRVCVYMCMLVRVE